MNKVKVFVVLLLCIFAALLVAGFYSINNVHIEGTYKLEEQQILKKDEEYYLLIDDHELLLPKQFHDKIELETYDEYTIKYTYNKLKNNAGEVVKLKRYGEQPWGK